jgi:hypothetical protein
VTPTGLELPSVTRDTDNNLGNPPTVGAAKSGAVETGGDADLARVVAVWSDLPEPIRRAVLAMIAAAP